MVPSGLFKITKTLTDLEYIAAPRRQKLFHVYLRGRDQVERPGISDATEACLEYFYGCLRDQGRGEKGSLDFQISIFKEETAYEIDVVTTLSGITEIHIPSPFSLRLYFSQAHGIQKRAVTQATPSERYNSAGLCSVTGGSPPAFLPGLNKNHKL